MHWRDFYLRLWRLFRGRCHISSVHRFAIRVIIAALQSQPCIQLCPERSSHSTGLKQSRQVKIKPPNLLRKRGYLDARSTLKHPSLFAWHATRPVPLTYPSTINPQPPCPTHHRDPHHQTPPTSFPHYQPRPSPNAQEPCPPPTPNPPPPPPYPPSPLPHPSSSKKSRPRRVHPHAAAPLRPATTSTPRKRRR